MRDFLKEYPGIKWLAGSAALIGIGAITATSGLYGAGAFLVFVGGLGTIVWRSRDELRHGWPPRFLAELKRRDDQDD